MQETHVPSPDLGRSPGGGHGHPLQYSCLENPYGQRILVGDSTWGCKELDTAVWLSTAHSAGQLSTILFFNIAPHQRYFAGCFISLIASSFEVLAHHLIYLCYILAKFLSSVQFSSVAQLVPDSATPWIAACQASLSITNSCSPPKPMSNESMMPSNHLILCRPLLLLPSIFSSIRVFSNESTLCIRWSKYWSFSFSISLSNEHPRLISFMMDWWDLLAVQGTLKSLLQHYSSKTSILRHSAFFIVQLSHPFMTTGKIIALTRWTFVGKILSLLFNMLSKLAIAFLPRNKRLLISWLQSPSAVILEPKKIKSVTGSIVSPLVFHEVMGPDAMILVYCKIDSEK